MFRDPASMRIVGTWRTCDDGVSRPVLRGVLFGAQGQPLTEWFLWMGRDVGCASRGFILLRTLRNQRPSGSRWGEARANTPFATADDLAVSHAALSVRLSSSDQPTVGTNRRSCETLGCSRISCKHRASRASPLVSEHLTLLTNAT